MFHTEIHIKGKIDPNWSDWFEEMNVMEEPPGNTLLCGNLRDKSAVYGVISRLSNLGITLISVSCQEMDHAPPSTEITHQSGQTLVTMPGYGMRLLGLAGGWIGNFL